MCVACQCQSHRGGCVWNDEGMVVSARVFLDFGLGMKSSHHSSPSLPFPSSPPHPLSLALSPCPPPLLPLSMRVGFIVCSVSQ